MGIVEKYQICYSLTGIMRINNNYYPKIAVDVFFQQLTIISYISQIIGELYFFCQAWEQLKIHFHIGMDKSCQITGVYLPLNTTLSSNAQLTLTIFCIQCCACYCRIH